MPEIHKIPEAPEARIRLKRAYRAVRVSDGTRVLVDRLWPRGIAKERLRLHLWMKEVAPSTDLRRQVHAGDLTWPEFQQRYRQELFGKDALLRQLAGFAQDGIVTLVYGAKDEAQNHAIVLRDYLQDYMAQAHGQPDASASKPLARGPDMSDPDSYKCQSGFSSPPCYAAEIAPDYFDPHAPAAVDPQQASDVARWRRSERKRLRDARAEVSVTERHANGAAISAHLRTLLDERFGGAKGRVFSAYWPIKGEPDLRPLMAELHAAGVIIALPIVETKAAPLIFRLWTPATKMQRGDWNIPVPPPDAPELTPEIALAPLVGWSAEGYRLGYGGGYFD
uniref:5-formyltetrahydrofolate cyclo-ligase n=1 Tax=Pararhodobacter oceanensis TaxID=2172121 RepID=UPI003A912099